MMDVNYLNHEFEPYADNGCEDFICKKCGVIMFYYDDTDFGYYIVEHNSNSPYGYLNGNTETTDILNINCEEFIIKKIIE